MPRCGLEVLSPKNSVFRRGVSVPLKVKNELGYTAYDLSLRGGATGEGFFSANFKCFFGKISRKRLFLFLLFVVFFFRTGCEECREMLQEASWESKDFQGPRWSRFISYHFLMVWWDPSFIVSWVFYSNLGSLRSQTAGFVVSKHATRCQVATFLKRPWKRATFRMHIQCEGPRF